MTCSTSIHCLLRWSGELTSYYRWCGLCRLGASRTTQIIWASVAPCSSAKGLAGGSYTGDESSSGNARRHYSQTVSASPLVGLPEFSHQLGSLVYSEGFETCHRSIFNNKFNNIGHNGLDDVTRSHIVVVVASSGIGSGYICIHFWTKTS
jgi:hypothetical protein